VENEVWRREDEEGTINFLRYLEPNPPVAVSLIWTPTKGPRTYLKFPFSFRAHLDVLNAQIQGRSLLWLFPSFPFFLAFD